VVRIGKYVLVVLKIGAESIYDMERAIAQDKNPGVCGHAPVLLHAADEVLGRTLPYVVAAKARQRLGQVRLRSRARSVAPHAKNSYVSVSVKGS